MSQTKLEKTCTKCGQSKALGDFHRRAATKKDGLQPRCKECELERLRIYREEKREKVAEGQRKWYAANREAVKKYREENKEQIARVRRSYRQRNKARIMAVSRRWYDENREEIRAKAREYAAENLEKGRARQHKRRGATPESTPEVVALMKTHKGMPCFYCGTFDPNPFNRTTDHVVPVSSGLPNTQVPENMVPACRACNCSKGDKGLEVWLEERGPLGTAI